MIGRLWRWWVGPNGARTAQLLVLATGLSVLWLGYEQDRIERCNRAYNEATSKVSQARAEAADRRAEALARAMEASLLDETTYRQTASAYLAAWAEEKRVRAENPLVPPPSDYCG